MQRTRKFWQREVFSMHVLNTLRPTWSRSPQSAGADLNFPTSNSETSSSSEDRVPPLKFVSRMACCQAFGEKFDTMLIVHWGKRQLMLRGGKHSKFEHSQTSKLFSHGFPKQLMSKNENVKVCSHVCACVGTSLHAFLRPN